MCGYNNKFCMMLVLSFVLFSSGCGTLVGNPKQPSEDGGESQNMIALPDYNFQVPSVLLEEGDGYETSLNLVTDNDLLLTNRPRFTLIHSLSFRMNRVLSQTQKIIRHVADDDLVQTAGEHRAKGKLQNVDLRIEELPEGSDYQYEALFCNEGEKFLQLRWREGQVQVIRSLGKNPRGEIESTDYLAEITITTLEDRVVTEYSANGRYRVPPISRKEGSFLREYTRHTVVNGEQVNIEAVHDWYASEEDEVEGEFYAVSQLSLSENSGSFLGYDKKYVNLCSEKSVEELPLEEGSPLFLEPKNENLCFGRALGEAKEFTRRERLEEFSKLKKLSLPSVQNIRSVSFSSELTCPQ